MKTHDEEHVFHINVSSDGYTSKPYTPLLECFLILNLKAANKLKFGNASQAKIRTPSGATCKGVLQLEASFIEVKNMYLHQDSNSGLWNTIPML